MNVKWRGRAEKSSCSGVAALASRQTAKCVLPQ